MRLLIVISIILSSFVLSAESQETQTKDLFEMTMEEFFASEQNQKIYQQLVDSGKLDALRQQSMQICQNVAATDDEQMDCGCMTEVMQTIDGRVLVFDTMVAYKSYVAKVEATKAKDTQELERLKALDKKRVGLTQILEQKCGKQK